MPRNKYPEETVQKILEVSLKLFMEQGYENTTVLDIVNNLGGLTRGAFYHHFKSKEEVIDALTDKMFHENNPFEKVKRQKELNGLQKLQQIIKDATEESDIRKLNAQAVSLLENPKFLAEFITSNRDILVPAYQELIEEGIRDGSIKNDSPKQTAEIITFMTNFWMVPTIFPFTKEEGSARLKMVKELSAFMGVPLLDDEIMQQLEADLAAYEEEGV